MKGNCLQRDDEEPLDLRFRTVKQSVKSTMERKESLLSEVAEEDTELELVLEGLGLNRKKRVDSRSSKVRKVQSTSLARPNPVKLSKAAKKYLMKWMLKALPASGTTGSSVMAKDKKRRVEPSGQSGEKVVEGRSALVDDLKEVKEWARLAVLQGEEDTSKMVAHHVKGIWPGIEEEKSELKKAILKRRWMPLRRTLMLGKDEEEAEAVGIVDGLDGVPHQTVLDNQGDGIELPEGGSEKAVREMSLKINDLESGLAREREASKALLYAQAELEVELDSSRSREDDVLMRNREFVGQFNKMKEANEKKEDQYVKAHFRLLELTQAVSYLTLQVEEKDSELKKGLKKLAEVTECVEKNQRQVDVLTVKGNVQKGNANLRECQHKLDAALIREKVLEGEIKAKESLVKRKDDLLKDMPAREELSAEIGRLRTRVVDSEAINIAKSAKSIVNLEENVIYHGKVDAEMTEL
ncbi:hypothetical protein GIB67_035333 [Kingdonia uniflora]|uniref:Uncharacterized protein n=1 Tax=Kingdonia uniflora TaxID=39325 RepID=A0A7J7LY53_9MAGN|nr:hypothetical protein GIB67_035333 [Kingdonia uniflora]